MYLNGAALAADARLRLEALESNIGLLIVEGGDDRLLFGDRCVPLQQILAAGGKSKVLDARARLTESEQARIAFVVDCDYDVATGALRGAPNFVLTEHADADADLFVMGGLSRVVLHCVRRVATDRDVEQLTHEVYERAVALAEV